MPENIKLPNLEVEVDRELPSLRAELKRLRRVYATQQHTVEMFELLDIFLDINSCLYTVSQKNLLFRIYRNIASIFELEGIVHEIYCFLEHDLVNVSSFPSVQEIKDTLKILFGMNALLFTNTDQTLCMTLLFSYLEAMRDTEIQMHEGFISITKRKYLQIQSQIEDPELLQQFRELTPFMASL